MCARMIENPYAALRVAAFVVVVRAGLGGVAV